MEDTTEYKVVYYKNNEMIIEKCIGKVWWNQSENKPSDKYIKYHTRIYPADYEPTNGYGMEQLIESW